MLDYKDIITKYNAEGCSGEEITRMTEVSRSGVNDFLKTFKACKRISYPL